MEPEAVLVVVPEREAPDGLIAIEILPLKLSTSLPDTSSALIAGWVARAVRFTAPLAAVTISSWVAVP